MNYLVFNPQLKDFFNAKACVAISRRYNYAGSCRSRRTYRFPYLSFMTWSSSYRAAFCYVIKRLVDAAYKDESRFLVHSDICRLFFKDRSWTHFYRFLEGYLNNDDFYFYDRFSSVEKLSFAYKFLNLLIKYNLGYRYYSVFSMFEEKSAIRYAASKYFPDISFTEIESEFFFRDVMD